MSTDKITKGRRGGVDRWGGGGGGGNGNLINLARKIVYNSVSIMKTDFTISFIPRMTLCMYMNMYN